MIVFVLDLCCGDKQWLLRGGFKEEEMRVVGDVFHIQKRIYTEADTRHAQYSHFVGDVRKAFGSSETGVFWDGKKIISKLEEVKERWEKVGVWQAKTSIAFERQKTHILNCLELPPQFPAYILDRNGRMVLIRGTNKAENMWRWLRHICPEKLACDLFCAIFTCFVLQHNTRMWVQYDSRVPSWLHVPYYAAPELLVVNTLSKSLDVESPVPQLPFIDTTSRGYQETVPCSHDDNNVFLLEGAQQMLPVALSNKRSNCRPLEASQITEDMADAVSREIFAACSDCTATFEKSIADIEAEVNASSSSSTSTAASMLLSLATSSLSATLTSPQTNKTTQRKEEKKERRNKSRHGGGKHGGVKAAAASSHKLDASKKLHMTTKVTSHFYYTLYDTSKDVLLLCGSTYSLL